MCVAICLSCFLSLRSLTTKIQSKRDRIVVYKSIWSEIVRRSSYFPRRGLAAARTAVLEFRIVVIPALAIEMVYCSMASCRMVLPFSSILSNSSIQQIPLSAMTNAPPSNVNSPVRESFIRAAVRPTPDEPLPVV